MPGSAKYAVTNSPTESVSNGRPSRSSGIALGKATARPAALSPSTALAPGDVVITPAVDRLSRDTTDLLVIARDMQRAGAGIRSLAEPFLDTTSDFAEVIFAAER
jgi:DNA invertase Pin-like site-specific DNA recombinase